VDGAFRSCGERRAPPGQKAAIQPATLGNRTIVIVPTLTEAYQVAATNGLNKLRHGELSSIWRKPVPWTHLETADRF